MTSFQIMGVEDYNGLDTEAKGAIDSVVVAFDADYEKNVKLTPQERQSFLDDLIESTGVQIQNEAATRIIVK